MRLNTLDRFQIEVSSGRTGTDLFEVLRIGIRKGALQSPLAAVIKKLQFIMTNFVNYQSILRSTQVAERETGAREASVTKSR